MLFTKIENTETWQDLIIKRAFVSGCMTGISFMLSIAILVNVLVY